MFSYLLHPTEVTVILIILIGQPFGTSIDDLIDSTSTPLCKRD